MLESDPRPDRDEAFAKALQAYLVATLHTPITLRAWAGAEALPVFMAHRYQFYSAHIARRTCIFVVATTTIETTPADIAKHVALVEGASEDVVVFAGRYMTSTLRARLVALGVAFAVPGNQLYIPQLAMDLREHFRTPDRVRRDHLSPVAQAVLFHHVLYGRQNERLTPSALAEQMHYSAMSVGRAFDELALRNLATVERRGREKTLTYNTDRRTLIEISRTLLRTPRRGRHGVQFKRGTPPLMLAGESALAALTDLNPPRLPTYAIEAADWAVFFAKHGIKEVNDIDEAEAIIETWRYDPRSLAPDGDIVDPLSLHAEYWDDPDERLAQAAQKVLEALW